MHKTQFRKIQFVQDKNTWKYPAQNENEKKICGYFYLEQIVFFWTVKIDLNSSNFCVAQCQTMRAGLNTSLKDCKKMIYLISAEREFVFLSWGFGLEERFPKEDFFFFFAMRQNRIDDALMMHACAMHACWDRFSKKHRLLNFFRFPARSKSLMYYPTGNKKEIRGFVLDWWLLVITYFWIWKKINRIHYGVQLLCCSGYSPAYHSRANDCLRMPLFLLPTQNTYWVLSKFQ